MIFRVVEDIDSGSADGRAAVAAEVKPTAVTRSNRQR